MKKFLLSALTLTAAAAAWATVPEFNPSGSAKALTLTNDEPSYYTPACASADNNKFFFAGQFQDTFEFTTGSGDNATTTTLDAGDFTSAYVVSYGSYGSPLAAFVIEGAAQVTAMTCDDKNLYVAGVFADKVTLHSASATGKTEDVEGLKLNDKPVAQKSASFIAVYSQAGELQSVKTFIPSELPALLETGMYEASGEDLFFHISDIQYYDGKLYFAANYTGETKIGDATLDGTYQDPWGGVYFMDIANSAVVSLDTETLSAATIEMSVKGKGPFTDDSATTKTITFNVSKAGLYGAFIPEGIGELTVKNGTLSETLTLTGETPEIYAVAGAGSLAKLEKKASDNLINHNVISTVLVDNGKVWMLGSADVELPSTKAGEGTAVTGSNDLFVATFSANDLSLKSVVGNASEEGSTEIENSDNKVESKPNYERPQGAVTVNDYLMLIYNTLDFEGDYISSSTKLFTGTEFKAAESTPNQYRPNAVPYPGATGICRNNGSGVSASYNTAIIALPMVAEIEPAVSEPDPAGSAAATEGGNISFTYQYGSFNQDLIQSGINAIAADYVDENAPVEYFNLQGIRISNPAEGQVVIRRQGSKAEKIVF